jgi:hypothetical protein
MASSVNKAPTGPALVKNEPPPKTKTKASRILPFERVTFAKQLEILRAYAAASLQGTVSNAEVASIVGLAPETVSMCNGFYSSVGFIQKGEGGWIVAPDVQAFHRAFDWNKETASHKLAPLLQSSWFALALQSNLSFRPHDEDEAIELLADAANASRDHKRQLRMLLELLEAAGLILRDGTHLKSRVTSMPEQSAAQRPETPKEQSGETPPARPKVATAFSQIAQGTMRFNVSFDMDLSELSNWRPDRIATFLNGIAQILAAKAEVEKTAGS